MGFFGGGGAAPANMVGATDSAAGTAGLVPAPAAGKTSRALFSNASFAEVPLFPRYKNTDSGIYITNYEYGYFGAQGGTTAALRVRRFGLIYLPADGQIDVIAYRTSSAPTTSVNCHVALWLCADDGKPSTLVVDGVGACGTTANTDIAVSVSAATISQGFYWISMTPESAISSFGISRMPANVEGYSNWLGNASLNATNTILGYTATTYNQTTHETFTFLASQPFRMGVQYV